MLARIISLVGRTIILYTLVGKNKNKTSNPPKKQCTIKMLGYFSHSNPLGKINNHTSQQKDSCWSCIRSLCSFVIEDEFIVLLKNNSKEQQNSIYFMQCMNVHIIQYYIADEFNDLCQLRGARCRFVQYVIECVPSSRTGRAHQW